MQVQSFNKLLTVLTINMLGCSTLVVLATMVSTMSTIEISLMQNI